MNTNKFVRKQQALRVRPLSCCFFQQKVILMFNKSRVLRLIINFCRDAYVRPFRDFMRFWFGK